MLPVTEHGRSGQKSADLPAVSAVTEAEFFALLDNLPVGGFAETIRACLSLSKPVAGSLAVPLAIAVSGGADSMALAFLLQRWWLALTEDLPDRPLLKAFIVDHGLRPDSAAEAAWTAQRLAGMGLSPQILTIPPLPPGSVQEKARELRFAALEQVCSDSGIIMLFLAHHEADQEETIWMRHERGSGLRGLCGMAHIAICGRVMLLRPLLSIPPQRLRATLQQAGLDWCEDPSNRNRRFRRVQIRQDMTAPQGAGMQVIGHHAPALYQGKEAVLARFLAEYCAWQAEGWVQLEGGFFGQDTGISDIAVEALALLMRQIGGQAYPPDRKQARALYQRQYGTLAGAILHRRVKDWYLIRDSRHIQTSLPAKNGQLWDGRWRYLGPDLPDEYKIQALGPAGRAVIREEHGRKKHGEKQRIPARALEVLPVLWHGDKVHAVPEGVRGLCLSLPRMALLWGSKTPLTGEKSFIRENL